jgi:acetylornithine/N-succinyldiaminopimelate aminotransferase
MFETRAAIIAPAEVEAAERFPGERHLLQNYARAPVAIVRGEGCELIDAEGNRYLDLVAGIAVCALGHAHPAITEAVAKQAGTLVQASNLFYHEPAGTLANELSARSGFERVFFCNSGAEANEAAIKLARKLAYRKGETERRTILACTGSFHGRTMGALAATENPHYHEGFEPLPGGFAFVRFNDVAALEAAIDRTTAAVHRGTRAGRERHQARGPRVSRSGAPALRRTRRAFDLRRDPVRHGPARNALRVRP